MGKTVGQRIAEVRDKIVAAQIRGELDTPEKEERAANLLRQVIRRSIAMRIVELVGEGVGVRAACRIAYKESDLKVTEAAVRETAITFEKNWSQFVATAPVEVVSDAEFAELLQGGNGKGTIIA